MASDILYFGQSLKKEEKERKYNGVLKLVLKVVNTY